MESRYIQFNYSRKFGAEFEFNAFDNRDFQNNPLNEGDVPEGSEYVALLIREKLNQVSEVHGWHHTHNNNYWIVKPDSSCGIEVCAPPTRGWNGLKDIVEFVDIMNQDENVKSDERCSFHVHIDVSDLTKEEVAKIIIYWLKFEAVFLDSVPLRRKRSRYCQQIGITDLIQHNTKLKPFNIINLVGDVKYYTMNCFHYKRDNRKSIEFRIMEEESCLDAYAIKNWIRLIVHFVESVLELNYPTDYIYGDKHSGCCWLDLSDLIEILHFDQRLSKGMKQTRNWFLSRIYKNVKETNSVGLWTKEGRIITEKEVSYFIEKFNIDVEKSLKPRNFKQSLYAQTNSI